MSLYSLKIKRGAVFIVSLFLFGFNLSANPLLASSKKEQNRWCFVSGEPLLKSYKTNFIVTLSDNSKREYISIRFLAEDFDAIKDRVLKIETIDYKTENLIDAKRVFFLIDSKIKSKFSKYSKVAFENESDAKTFQKKYQGKIRDFNFVLYVSSRDSENDKKLFAKKLQKKEKRGERIYLKICPHIEVDKSFSLINLKSNIKRDKNCKNLKEKDLHSLALYLWNIKRVGKIAKIEDKMQVPDGAKCPVCGMFVYKYPKWAAKIKLQNHTHYFDGVKDMMKYYFDPQNYIHNHTQKDFKEITVTDYYSLKEIQAKEAFYVTGSNVYGPMGNELIPFKSQDDALEFKKSHYGKIIVKFDEITKKMVWDLDR